MMIAWINFIVLLTTTFLCFFYYVKSAGPAALEEKIGLSAYHKCTQYRIAASIFMTIAGINYVVYVFYPLPISFPQTFPWPWWVSVVIAILITIPSGYLFWRGMKDAGEETIVVKKEHKLYGGIYQKIRHPQAAGEVVLWWTLAFLANLPFLAIYSFIWLPIFYAMCLVEEKDLVIRYGDAYRSYQKETGFLFPKGH